MKRLISICAITFLAACNNGDDNGVYMKLPDRAIRDSVKNPATVQPPSEAIPQDMKIVNDSLIKAKDSANRNTQAATSDTLGKR